MRIFSALFVFLLVHYASIAQEKVKFYDFGWRPAPPQNAAYSGTIEKTDSGWLRQDYYLTNGKLQKRVLYADDSCKVQNGDGYFYHVNGVPSVLNRCINGKEEGIVVKYHSNGMIADSALYHNGQVIDKRFRWHRNGYISDSISRVNDSLQVQVSWFDDGTLAGAGYLLHGENENRWKYFHHNGQLSALIVYRKGEQIGADYFDEEGKPQSDTSNVNRAANLKGGEKAWKKYLEKNLSWPPNTTITTTGIVTLLVRFTVDETGKINDAELTLPFHEAFDKLALKLIQNSPDWQPAIQHNRKIKAYRLQPLFFTSSEE